MSEFLPLDEEELLRQDHELRRLARRVVHSQADAEDVAQEVWLRTLEKPPRHDQHLSGWWRTVTRRAALRIVGRERWRRSHLRDAARPATTSLEPDREGSRAAVERLISRLDDPYREVLRLRFLEDLTPAEIGQVLHRPEVTVRSQLKRGLDQLRAKERERRAFALWWPGGRRARIWVAAAGSLAVLGLIALTGSGPDSLPSPASPFASQPETELEDIPSAPPSPERVELDAFEAAPLAPEVARPAEPASIAIEGRVVWLEQAKAEAEIFAALTEDGPGQSVGRTETDGRFQVRVAPGAILWAETIERDATGTIDLRRVRSKRYVLAGQEGTLDIEFVYLRLMKGTLLDVDLRPVVGARLTLVEPPETTLVGAQEVLELSALPSEARTDEEGRFELPIRNTGRHRLRVEIEGRPGYTAELPSRLEVRVVLPRFGGLSGRLVTADGVAVAGAELRLLGPDRTERPMGSTDAQGRFRIEGMPPGTFELRGGVNASSSSMFVRDELVEGSERDLGDLVVGPSASIVGNASAPDGSCAGWRVRSQADSDAETRETLVGADGSFVIQGCAPTAHELVLLHPRLGGVAGVSGIRPGAAPVRLEARPMNARVRGRRSYVPPAGSRLMLSGDALGRALELTVGSIGFEEPLPAGSYVLHEVLPGLGTWEHARFELAPGETRDFELVLPPTGSLTVHLHFGEELVLASSLLLTLRSQGFGVQFVSSRPPANVELDLASGRLRFPRLLPGDFRFDVSARGLGMVHRTLSVRAGEELSLAVELRPGSPVEVPCRSTRDLAHDERLFFELVAVGMDYEGEAQPDLLGTSASKPVYFFRRELAAGAYDLHVWTSGGLEGRVQFELPGDEKHELLMQPRATLPR